MLDDSLNIEPTSPIFSSGTEEPSSPIFGFPSSPIVGQVDDDSDNEEIKETLEKLDYYSASVTTSQGSSDDLGESFCYRSRTNKRTVARRRKSTRKESSQVLQESVFNDSDLIYSSSSQETNKEQRYCGIFTGFCIIAPDFTPEERDQYSKLVKDNGGMMAIIKKDFTWYSEGLEAIDSEKLVLISDSPKSRPSYLAALMLNIPLLKKEWILDCISQQSIIVNEMEKYLLPRGTIITPDGTSKEEKQEFNSTFQIVKKEKRPLFGISVKINSGDVKFIESWKKVLESGGATVGDIATYSSKHVQNKNFVLVRDSSEISKQRLDYFNIKKVPILNRDSLVQMIVTSNYNFEDLKITKLSESDKPKKPNLIIPTPAFLNDSLTSPYYTPTPTPSVIPNRRKMFETSSSNNLASKWFSNVKDDSLVHDPNASVIDIRSNQSAKKKAVPAKNLNSTMILNSSLMNTSNKKIKLDKLERSFSTSFMNNSLQINTSMVEGAKYSFDDLSNLTSGDYFLKQEKTNQQKTCFVRLSKQKVLCGKRKYEESTDWKIDQFFLGDMVAVNGPFTDVTRFIRMDQLYYKDYVTESKEMLGTEYIPDSNSKKLISTSKTIRVDLSSINHKLLVGNLETGTTKKKRMKKQYYSDYVFKNFDFKEIEDASVKSLHTIPHELALLADLEMKRERKIKSLRMKNPFYVRFTGADFNGRIFEEGNFVKLHERDLKEPIVCYIREIRERDLAHFCNQFMGGSSYTNNGDFPPIRPSASSSVIVDVLTCKSTQHYIFAHQVEEIMFSRIHSMEPLVAIERHLVDKWMKEAGCSCCPKCGLDTKELPVGFDAFLFNNFVNRLVNNMDVCCPNKDSGCQEKSIKRCNYWDHLEKECKGRRFKCENVIYGCKFEGNGLQMEVHRKDECLFEKEEIKQLFKRIQVDQEGLVSMNKQLVSENQQSKQNIEAMLRNIDVLNTELAKEKEINLQYQQKLQAMLNPVSALPPPPPYSMMGEYQYNPVQTQGVVIPTTRKFRFYGKTVWTKFQGKTTNSEVPGWEVLIDVDDIASGDNVRGSNKNSGVTFEKKYTGFIRDGILDITVEWTDGRRAKYFSNNILLAQGSPIKLSFEIVSCGKQGGTVGDCGFNQGMVEQLQ